MANLGWSIGLVGWVKSQVSSHPGSKYVAELDLQRSNRSHCLWPHRMCMCLHLHTAYCHPRHQRYPQHVPLHPQAYTQVFMEGGPRTVSPQSPLPAKVPGYRVANASTCTIGKSVPDVQICHQGAQPVPLLWSTVTFSFSTNARPREPDRRWSKTTYKHVFFTNTLSLYNLKPRIFMHVSYLQVFLVLKDLKNKTKPWYIYWLSLLLYIFFLFKKNEVKYKIQSFCIAQIFVFQ